MLAHEGRWEGVYTHIDTAGRVLERHQSSVTCVFPETGPYAYVQYNRFTWDDGRVVETQLPGVLREGKLWWDTDTFSGCAWQTDDDLILLNLKRKDDPGAHFVEIIALGASGVDRARTWHWFKDGALFKRTLCDERLVDRAAGAP